jgi:hypothetical protein
MGLVYVTDDVDDAFQHITLFLQEQAKKKNSPLVGSGAHNAGNNDGDDDDDDDDVGGNDAVKK